MKRMAAVGTLAFLLLGCSLSRVAPQTDAIHLEILFPDAGEVFFASSLDGFSLHPAAKGKDGRWRISVTAKTEFRYFFLVDGKQVLPPCRMKEADDFGFYNCIAGYDG